MNSNLGKRATALESESFEAPQSEKRNTLTRLYNKKNIV